MRNHAFNGEIKDKCILQKAIKFTGRREGAQRVSHSLGFDFELFLLDAFFARVKHNVPEEDKVPLISVHILL